MNSVWAMMMLNKTILKVGICLLLCIISAYFGYDYGVSKESKKFLEYRVTQKEALIVAQKQHQRALVKTQKEKEDAIKALNKHHAAIVDSLQQRPLRDSRPNEGTNSPATVCTGTGSTGDRLYREDAEFLIGEAAKADILRQALKACRAQLQ